MSIDPALAENYEAVIADPNRGITYETLAESDSPDLAAWARKRAAEAGKSVKPANAKTTSARSTR
jgi:hypothetical protein